jgi:histidinol-phosphate/aromatic aminotransferase/cobyric acid decarboxylase-like protein
VPWASLRCDCTRVAHATTTTAALRRADIGVRDATSFGLPHALRLSAQPPRAQDALITELERVRTVTFPDRDPGEPSDEHQ